MCCDQVDSKLPNVYIGIPCYGSQTTIWWTKVLANLVAENGKTINLIKVASSGGMTQDNNKNRIIMERGPIKRMIQTDANRIGIVDGFMASSADWLFFIDDDTIFPLGAIGKMIDLRREFVSGLYFQDKSYNPVAYVRRADGMYNAYHDFPREGLFQVDSVGMGCALIHRSVFQKIMDEHTVFLRPNGSLLTVHKSQIRDKKPLKGGGQPYVQAGRLHTPLQAPSADDDRPWPFFALEWSRTEDHHFCELCNNVGIRPWLDTSIQCEHIKTVPVTMADFEASRKGATA